MRFSVVVPTHQRRSLVLAAMRALARQDVKEDYEIIVVVDGSTDGSADALRSLRLDVPLRVIEQANMGLSAARNAGARAAQGDLLVFLDDDMEADAHLLSAHGESHADGPAIVIGHIPLHPESPRSFLAEAVEVWAEERRKRLTQLGVCCGLKDWVMGQSSLPRSVFFELGGFDSSFTRSGSYGNEDLEFCHRASKADIAIVFNPRALSWQRYVVSTGTHLDQWRQSGRADVLLARKYPELLDQIFGADDGPSWLSRMLYRPLRRLSLSMLAAGLTGRRSQGLFFYVRQLAYAEGVRLAGGAPRGSVMQILCYHAIENLDGTVLGPYGVSPERFREQLSSLLRCGYQFVVPAEFLSYLQGQAGLPRRALLLTFDDCYQSLYNSALPILQDLGVVGVAFAVSRRIGASNDWDAHLGAPTLRLVDCSGLQELAAAGIEIGVHSRSHLDLTKLSDQELRSEISKPLLDLEAKSLQPFPLLAYPYGEHDQRVRNAVQVGGYEAAVTTEPGIVTTDSNRYRLPRIEVMAGDATCLLRLKLFRNRLRERARSALTPSGATTPRVSLVVPAYNAEATLAETLASVRAQTFAAWEAIIVDDGSTDATGEVAAAWCESDTRFRVVRRENGGEAAARNTGLATASAEWLVFLDADDWIAPEYLQRMVGAAVGQKGLDGIVCGCVRVTPSGLFSEPAVYLPGDLRDPFPDFVRSCPLAIHNCMIRRSIANEVGGFDVTLETCADWDFWQRVARWGARLGSMPDILALYRTRPDSASTRAVAVMRDGFTVIRRGYGADPRVPASGELRYRDGLPVDDLPQALYRHALWPASMMVVSGEERRVLLDALAEIGDAPLNAGLVAEELFHNIPLAAGEVVQSWPKLYARLETRCVSFLRELEMRCGVAELADEVLRLLEQRILETAEFSDQLIVGSTLGLRIDVATSVQDIRVPAGTRRLVAVITESGKKAGAVALIPEGNRVSADTIIDRIVAELSWPLLRTHLGLGLARESQLAWKLQSTLLKSGILSSFFAATQFLISLLRWQRDAGAIRNRWVARDLLRMLSELRPLRLTWRLIRTSPDERGAVLREALVEASARCVRAQFPALAERS